MLEVKRQTGRLKSDKYPEDTILVEINYDEEENEIINDNLTAILLKDQVVNLLNRTVSSIYKNPNIIYEIPDRVLPEEFDKNTTLREYISNYNSMPLVAIILGSDNSMDNKEEDIEELRVTLKENHIFFDGLILYTEDKAVNQVNSGNINGFINQSSNILARCDFYLDSDYEFIILRW